MYTTKRAKEKDSIKIDGLKPRNKALHEVLSTRRGGPMQDKHKSRAAQKEDLRKDFE